MTEPLPVVLLVSAQHPRACGVVDSALPATACATRTQPTRGLTCVQQLPQLRLNLTTRSCVGGPTAHKFAGTSNTGRSRAPLLSSQAQCRCPCRFPKGYVTASRRLARKDVRCVVPLDAVDCPQFDLYRAVPPPRPVCCRAASQPLNPRPKQSPSRCANPWPPRRRWLRRQVHAASKMT